MEREREKGSTATERREGMAQYLAENERFKRDKEGQRKMRRGFKARRSTLLANRVSPRTVIRRAFVPAEGEAEERQLAIVDRSGRVGAGRLFGHVVQVLGREIGRVGQRAVVVCSRSGQYDRNNLLDRSAESEGRTEVAG